MWTDSWFDGMMCSYYFRCTYWSWLSVYTVDYLCWFHCAWDSNVPIRPKVKTGFLASGTEMPVESFPVRPSQIILWQRAFGIVFGMLHNISTCLVCCILTLHFLLVTLSLLFLADYLVFVPPKGCFTMPNIWEWWWSQSDGAFLAEDIAKQPLLSPMKRWNKVFR